MSNTLIETIISGDESLRNRSIDSLLGGRSRDELLCDAIQLEDFRSSSVNLYHRVRASLFLFVIYRFYLQCDTSVTQYGEIPFAGVKAAFDRDFERSIQIYLDEMNKKGKLNSAVFSAIADSYYNLSFKYLLDQVKLSISRCRENYDLYHIEGLSDYPFTVPGEMVRPDSEYGRYPVEMDASPVRLDPSHSGWSDIFFLGMDFPEGARVVNISVDLSIHGSDGPVGPPCECYCRCIEDPVIRLVSVDLHASKEIDNLSELFNFGNDHLSLLKAGVVASGVVPPCFENKDIRLEHIMRKLLGRPGGIEVVTRVNGIPKGSRLAVSTTLLSAIITCLMRFSGQIRSGTGTLSEDERRTVASRAILGEWLGGSGGGWQDSGGLWPGIKVIRGLIAEEGHPEFGISRGCLLPVHSVFTEDDLPPDIRERILGSLVLVHGGISQDVGPVLEMVTGKYLLKHEKEWKARLKSIALFEEIIEALKSGDMKRLGMLTTEDWEGPLQDIIPWVNNAFTEELIRRVKEQYGDDYWGFLMLGGMSGGGMAFVVNPSVREPFKKQVALIMHELKDIYQSSYPFIIDPVVYDFDINHDGIVSKVLKGRDAVMPGMIKAVTGNNEAGPDEEEIKERYGFDERSHEHTRGLLRRGEIGLAKNRLEAAAKIRDVAHNRIMHYDDGQDGLLHPAGHVGYREAGTDALKNNEIAVVTFAGGTGSRWSHGAAVVKPVNPFIKMEGGYRTFLEIHLAKSRKTSRHCGRDIDHVFTTSYLTHDAIRAYLDHFHSFGYEGSIYLSPGGTIGRRVVPMERDLVFFWEEQLQRKLDDNAQKVENSVRMALIDWAKSRGEGTDYSESSPILRFNPPGHWYEIPNLFKNGTLARMLGKNPGLKYILCHNIDTLGADIEPVLLGMHIKSGSCLSFEVIPKRIEDTGGGLAEVNGHVRLLEGLALPSEEDEFRLSYYNTLTNWITIDSLLELFGLDRTLLLEAEHSPEKQARVLDAVRGVEKSIPVYVTIKNVKYIWGGGQEDVFPVAQFERLWGDMSALRDLNVNYVSVSRYRGSQLKEPSLLDVWKNDGSFDYVKSLCAF